MNTRSLGPDRSTLYWLVSYFPFVDHALHHCVGFSLCGAVASDLITYLSWLSLPGRPKFISLLKSRTLLTAARPLRQSRRRRALAFVKVAQVRPETLPVCAADFPFGLTDGTTASVKAHIQWLPRQEMQFIQTSGEFKKRNLKIAIIDGFSKDIGHDLKR